MQTVSSNNTQMGVGTTSMTEQTPGAADRGKTPPWWLMASYNTNPQPLRFVSLCLFKSPEMYGNYLFLSIIFKSVIGPDLRVICIHLCAMHLKVICVHVCVCVHVRVRTQDEGYKYLHKKRNCETIWRQATHSTAHHWLISELSSIISNKRE